MEGFLQTTIDQLEFLDTSSPSLARSLALSWENGVESVCMCPAAAAVYYIRKPNGALVCSFASCLLWSQRQAAIFSVPLKQAEDEDE